MGQVNPNGNLNNSNENLPELNKPTVKEKDSSTVWRNPNKIDAYKIITIEGDTTHVDTTLTIHKDYKFNYLRKDDFELMPFSNLGQAYTRLSFSTDNSFITQMGQRGKQYNYMSTADIFYYDMPTPMTELMFKTSMEQGQLLDAFLTFNTSRQLNMSIAYKGMRSLGKYQNIRSSTGNFRFTTNYFSRNKRYDLKIHYVAQDLSNQENGGILNNEDFTSGEDEFTDRSRIEVNLDDAENVLIGKRYFIQNKYNLLKPNDSVQNNLLFVGHTFNYETRNYSFTEDASSDFLGEAYLSSNLEDKVKYRTMRNDFFAEYYNTTLGRFRFAYVNYNYNYFYNSITNVGGITVPNQYKGNESGFEAQYKRSFGKLRLKGELAGAVNGFMLGTSFNAEAGYQLSDDVGLGFGITSTSKMPNLNFLMYQSDYVNYNWYNVDTFNNQKTNAFYGHIQYKNWIKLEAQYSILDNYTYFEEQSLEGEEVYAQVKPTQYSQTINHLKAKLTNNLSLGKFSLENTLMYQNVQQSQSILNLPEFTTRNSLYYSSHIFKKAMYLQTGVTVKYFTQFYADKYNPLLADYSVQSDVEIGNFPMLDFFINAKVKQTRIYLKAEHLNALFSNNNYYSAPNNPYRDFIVRFGLVWNFFS